MKRRIQSYLPFMQQEKIRGRTLKQSEYSEEELQKTLQELFQEKKRVKELQKEFKTLEVKEIPSKMKLKF